MKKEKSLGSLETANKYVGYIKTISKKIGKNIFEIDNINELLEINNTFNISDLEINKKHNRVYSSAFKKYKKFVLSKQLKHLKEIKPEEYDVSYFFVCETIKHYNV